MLFYLSLINECILGQKVPINTLFFSQSNSPSFIPVHNNGKNYLHVSQVENTVAGQ
jgi:hypothetical protein